MLILVEDCFGYMLRFLATHSSPFYCMARVGMLVIQLASERRPVLMEEILLEYSEFISLRRWSSSVLLVLMMKTLGKCLKK